MAPRRIFPNNLYNLFKDQKVTIAFGLRLCPSPHIVQLASTNGYDALFIDMEHSVLDQAQVSTLSTAALLAGITPLVRVPHQCGNGYVQRVLDGGAMGVIFPHIHNSADAETAVAICKFPPTGKRSLTGQLPQYGLSTNPPAYVVEQTNSQGSAVGLMIETRSAIENIDSIAAVSGADLLLIGSNDLSHELGVPAQFESDTFRKLVEAVSAACRKHGKIFGLAGIYDRSDLHDWAINTLNARFILAQQDSGWIARGSKSCIEELRRVIV